TLPETPSESCNRSWSPLTEEGYAEKLRLLREASAIPMERWRAPTVLAWLEIALGMPQYGPKCAQNIKSGKLLDGISAKTLTPIPWYGQTKGSSAGRGIST
ncbi:unnamed protein product, partial [Nesidiocoris tenuis]